MSGVRLQTDYKGAFRRKPDRRSRSTLNANALFGGISRTKMDAQYGFLVHIGKGENQIGFVDLNHRSGKLIGE